MEWVSVKDRLPNEERGSIYSRLVLAVDINDGCIFCATYVQSALAWHDYYKAPHGKIDPITHWMEAPPLPKDNPEGFNEKK